MSEYITNTFVLGFKKTKETDRIYDLFTENFGRIYVLAPGSLKTLSRLAGHLVFGKISQVKIVEKNNLTIIDALTLKNFILNTKNKNFSFLKDFIILNNLLRKILPLGVPDKHLWNFLCLSFQKRKINFNEALALLDFLMKKCYF